MIGGGEIWVIIDTPCLDLPGLLQGGFELGPAVLKRGQVVPVGCGAGQQRLPVGDDFGERALRHDSPPFLAMQSGGAAGGFADSPPSPRWAAASPKSFCGDPGGPGA